MIQKYDSYKSSGIEWLGDIPTHWKIKKIKYFSYTKGRIGFHGLKSDEFLFDNGAYLITGTDFKNGEINWKNCRRVTEKRYEEDTNIHIKENDLLITKDGTIGKTAIVKNMPYKTTLNSGVLLVRTKKEICTTKFLYWLINSNVFKTFIDLKNTGSTVPHLYQNDFNNFDILLPQKEEQEAISNFLDKKCEGVDNYISKQKELIELLKEKKSSLINKAVTKGLDSKVEYKDSQIEWLGDIPKHWEVKKLKYIYKIIMGQSPNSSDVNQDKKGMAFLQGNAEFGKISPSEKNWCLEPKKIALKNDVLYSVRAPIGAVNIADKDYSIGRGLCSLRSSDNFNFLYYLSQSFKKEFDKYATGSTFEAISVAEIKNIFVPKVPKQEQNQIVEYIEKESSKIDKAISHIEDEIKLLQEYKQSLISSAVTGKIKVV